MSFVVFARKSLPAAITKTLLCVRTRPRGKAFLLIGIFLLGHCRYPTAGSSSCAEAQPLYTNYPHGICVAHNGNLTNTDALETLVRDKYMRHINTDSDSELLLNIFAEEMAQQAKLGEDKDDKDKVFSSISNVLQNCEGGEDDPPFVLRIFPTPRHELSLPDPY